MKATYRRHFCIPPRARGAGSGGMKRPVVSRYPLSFAAIPILFTLLWFHVAFAESRESPIDGKLPLMQQVITIGGEYVHTVGNLQMNVTNWGFLGSLPNSQLPMAESPSAQWPTGSGIEYL